VGNDVKVRVYGNTAVVTYRSTAKGGTPRGQLTSSVSGPAPSFGGRGARSWFTRREHQSRGPERPRGALRVATGITFTLHNPDTVLERWQRQSKPSARRRDPGLALARREAGEKFADRYILISFLSSESSVTVS
jgi:hypothetical protein